MGLGDITLRPCHTDVQRFANGFITCTVTTDVGHPVVLLIFRNAVAAIPCPVNQGRKTTALVHVPAFVFIGKNASFCRPMQQIDALSEPRLVASSVSTLLAVIDDVSHIPLAVLLEHRRTVYLVVVVRRSHHQTIFIRRAHLLVDALHVLLRNNVSGKTADHSKERYEDC